MIKMKPGMQLFSIDKKNIRTVKRVNYIKIIVKETYASNGDSRTYLNQFYLFDDTASVDISEVKEIEGQSFFNSNNFKEESYMEEEEPSIQPITPMEQVISDEISSEEDKKENKQPRATTSVLMQKVGDKKALAKELGIGELTLDDILKELEKPARDPREDMPRPLLRSDVMDLKDLKPGMVLKGTVRNVIDFGAFVDIGVHQDGLVHISQMTDKYIKHPLEAVSVGDVVDVEVMSVDIPKKRIQLTMKLSGKHK